MKRPLGLVCLLFILFIRLFYVVFPPSLPDYSSMSGREVYINGQVISISTQETFEETQIVYTLTDVVLSESSAAFDYFYSSDKDNSFCSTNATDQNQITSDKILSPSNFVYIEDQISCYSAHTFSGVHLGSSVWLRGTFSPYDRAENPGQFDSCFYYHIRGMGAVIEDARLIWSNKEADFLKEALQAYKHYFLERLSTVFDAKYGGVMKTMLYGDKSNLDSEIKNLFREGGILHILSISGMHISILGMGTFRLLRKCRMPKQICAVVGFAVIVLYGVMIGTGPSTFRAICMFTLQMAAILAGRTYDRLTGLSVAAVLLLLEQPLYIFYSGFLLSFGAVLGITAVPPLLQKLCKDKGILAKWGCKALGGSIGVLLFTFPIQILFYYEYPIYSIVVNILILPFMPYITGLGLVISLVPAEFYKMAESLAWICEHILEAYEELCLWSQKLPAHCLVLGAPRGWQIAVYYGGLLVLLGDIRWWLEGSLRRNCRKCHIMTFMQRSGKKVSMTIASLIFLCSIYLLLWHPTEGLKCHFLSVGQGDCAVMQYLGKAYIVDCGSTSNLRVSNQILLPFLKYYGISQVEGVFISHADADHMNGILQWLKEYRHSHVKINRLILPALDEEALKTEFGELLQLAEKWSIPVAALGAGDQLRLGEFTVKVLHPEKNCFDIEDANSYSQVLLFEYQGQQMLLTGDVGEAEEKQILDKFLGERPIAVLKAAHHGSKFSSSLEFLQGCRPRVVILSYGTGNSYGHPHRAAIERMEAVGASLYRTPKSGAVTVSVKKGRIETEEFLK